MNFLTRLRARRDERLLKRYALPDDLWQAALDALPFLDGVSERLRNELRATATLFLCKKSIIGAHGFDVMPFHRAVVAAQAALPILKLGLRQYDRFQTVVLQPDSFIADAEWQDEDGVVHRSDEPTLGEAMPGGPVVISWRDIVTAAKDDEAPINVVIHEFAHKLDMRDGDANGCPPLPPEISRREWMKTFQNAYDDFVSHVGDSDEDYLNIDAYASEDPAEFFAVVSEIYFIAPKILFNAYSGVYGMLRRYYGYEIQCTKYNVQCTKVWGR